MNQNYRYHQNDHRQCNHNQHNHYKSPMHFLPIQSTNTPSVQSFPKQLPILLQYNYQYINHHYTTSTIMIQSPINDHQIIYPYTTNTITNTINAITISNCITHHQIKISTKDQDSISIDIIHWTRPSVTPIHPWTITTIQSLPNHKYNQYLYTTTTIHAITIFLNFSHYHCHQHSNMANSPPYQLTG